MIKKWLLKFDRVIIFPLVIVTLTFLISGYSMTGHFYMNHIIPKELALKIHMPFGIAFLILFLLHSLISIYFSVLRRPVKAKIIIKLGRLCGWLLFVSTSVMLFSGFSMMGTINFISIQRAIQLHGVFSELTAVFFMVHAGINLFFIIKKWVRN